ncbi:MAG: COX15/CtaA family protein [Bacteroidota bacterium]
MKDADKKKVVLWLLSGCVLIFLMVVIGGITRLTGSGLSITEWNVVMGAVPPLNEPAWQEAFDKYKQIPQYQKLNYDFELSDFKKIFFWEYLHRLIGRMIGVVFLLPFLYFLWKKKLNREWINNSIFLFALGGLQGFLGWFMVKSGLTERTSVSHYRLAIHLVAAFITFGFTLWFALQLMVERKEINANRKIYSFLRILLGVVILQLIYGAFTAGLHAGRIANTFPTMDGEWIPSGINALSPGYMNLFENLLTVQFIHRMIAYTIVFLIFALWWITRKENLSSHQKMSIRICFLAVSVQFLLGIFTLLYHVPVTLAALHQVGGFFLFSSVIIALFFFSKPKLVA